MLSHNPSGCKSQRAHEVLMSRRLIEQQFGHFCPTFQTGKISDPSPHARMVK